MPSGASESAVGAAGIDAGHGSAQADLGLPLLSDGLCRVADLLRYLFPFDSPRRHTKRCRVVRLCNLLDTCALFTRVDVPMQPAGRLLLPPDAFAPKTQQLTDAAQAALIAHFNRAADGYVAFMEREASADAHRGWLRAKWALDK
jgi:hypothetical protein